MIFPKRNTMHEKRLFAVIGSIIGVTAILVTAGAATQLAFAAGACNGCRLSAEGSGSVLCDDSETPEPATISFIVFKGKGGDVSGQLSISTDSGHGLDGFITAGKISGAKYSLQGGADVFGRHDICGGVSSFSVSGPIGTNVPINFQTTNSSGSFTGTAQIMPPT
jgi:hypothetical protein